MKKTVLTIVLMAALIPFAYGQERSADTPQPKKKADTAQSQETIGDGIREAGREIETAGRKVRRAVVTQCADGRHTVRGREACAKHGGVSKQN